MNKLKWVFLIVFSCNMLSAQTIEGDWNGLLEVQGMKLRLVFHIVQNGDGYTATMDSPDQNAKGIPVTSAVFDNQELTLKIDAAGIVYKGIWEGDQNIKGTFNQMGRSFPLDLSREVMEKPKLSRPQEPQKPFPYLAEEVKFDNPEAGITLAGTLTIPDKSGSHPAAILISGSGPQTRDEEFMTHKPFLVLADHLTRQGIAVLRYDDRGFGESTGDHDSATSLDFAEDVKAAIAFLKSRPEVDSKKIGLIGHSEGGLIAPIVAAQSAEVGFVVLLAGPGVSGKEISLQQVEAIGKLQGLPDDILNSEKAMTQGVIEIVEQYYGSEALKTELKAYFDEKLKDAGEQIQGMDKEKFIQMNIKQVNRPWYAYFIQHQPSKFLEKVRCPVLAMNGGKDVQVTAQNLQAIEKALKKGGNQHFQIKEFPNMNHLFQECKTGAMSEYATIELTMSPIALKEISDWIQAIQ